MGLLLALVLILGLGLSIRLLPGPTPAVRPGSDVGTGKAPPVAAAESPDSGPPQESREQKLARIFERAVRLLHDKHDKEALSAWHEVLKLAPKLPEAHVNMGFTLLSLGRPGEARDFFNSAIDLRDSQANAYYGLALALDRLHETAGAIRAMRGYLARIGYDGRYAAKARLLIRLWAQRSAAAPSSGTGAKNSR